MSTCLQGCILSWMLYAAAATLLWGGSTCKQVMRSVIRQAGRKLSDVRMIHIWFLTMPCSVLEVQEVVSHIENKL